MRLFLREKRCSSEMLGYSAEEPPDEGERMRTEGRVEIYTMSFSSVFVSRFVLHYFVLVLRGADRGHGLDPTTQNHQET